MSGRIRSIKPEILEDDKTARLTDREWRLFVSMFSLADDYGNLRGSPEWISGQALWAFGMPNISEQIVRLEEVGLVIRYEVSGQEYLHITNWARHQKVDNPGKPRVPGPEGVQDPSMDDDGRAVTYIARRGEAGPIKIGFSNDPKARAEQLSKCQPEVVRILATIPGRKHEKALHRKFGHLRIAGTEWFEAKEEILSFVSSLSTERTMPVQCPAPGVHGQAMPRARGQDPDPDPDHGINDQDPPVVPPVGGPDGEQGDPWGLTPTAAPPTEKGKPIPKRKRSGKHPLPDDWCPSGGHREQAASLGLDFDQELTKFRDHAQATGRLLADWNAGFRMWLNKSREFVRTAPQSKLDARARGAAAFAAVKVED